MWFGGKNVGHHKKVTDNIHCNAMVTCVAGMTCLTQVSWVF